MYVGCRWSGARSLWPGVMLLLSQARTLDTATLRSLWSQHPEEDQWERGDDTWLSAHSEGGSISTGDYTGLWDESYKRWHRWPGMLTMLCLCPHSSPMSDVTWYMIHCPESDQALQPGSASQLHHSWHIVMMERYKRGHFVTDLPACFTSQLFSKFPLKFK